MREQFAAIAGGEQGALGGGIRVIQANAQHEAVELRIRQRIGPGQFHRILRRDDEERIRQFARGAVDGDLLFGHRLEQGALRFRRRAVDLVGQHELGEQGPRVELERAALALVHAHADNVGGQHVGRELDALEGKVQGRRQRMCQRGLADAGQVFDQQVPAGKDAGEGEAYLCGLAEDDAVDLGLRTLERGAECGIGRRCGCGGNKAGIHGGRV